MTLADNVGELNAGLETTADLFGGRGGLNDGLMGYGMAHQAALGAVNAFTETLTNWDLPDIEAALTPSEPFDPNNHPAFDPITPFDPNNHPAFDPNPTFNPNDHPTFNPNDHPAFDPNPAFDPANHPAFDPSPTFDPGTHPALGPGTTGMVNPEDLYSSTVGQNLRDSVTLQNRLIELQMQELVAAQERARIASEQSRTIGATLESSQTLLGVLGQRNMGASALLSIERAQLETLGATGAASRTLIQSVQERTLGASTLLSVERNQLATVGETLATSNRLNASIAAAGVLGGNTFRTLESGANRWGSAGVQAANNIAASINRIPRDVEVRVTERRTVVYDDIARQRLEAEIIEGISDRALPFTRRSS